MPTRDRRSLFLLVLLLNVRSLCAEPLFPRPVHPVGEQPYFVTTADLNRDGARDIITANFHSSDISVLMGDGHGDFKPQERLEVGDGPNFVAVGDLNGDGKPDLVVANYLSGDVSVLLGHGDGTFSNESRLSSGNSVFAVAIADVNGDHHADLLISNYGSGFVTCTLGKGDGTFDPQQAIIYGASAPTALVAADFNKDGKIDFAVADEYTGQVLVYLGKGNSAFHDPRPIDVGAYPEAIALADLNHDGRIDLAVANAGSDSVTVLLGAGSGVFHPVPSVAVGRFPLSVVATDVTGDGVPDLVTANSAGFSGSYGGDVSLLVGHGDGTFGADQRLTLDASPFFIAAADFNRDKKNDLVAVGQGLAQGATVLLNQGKGRFGPEPLEVKGGNPPVVILEDFNGDGKKDLVTDTPYFGTYPQFLPGLVKLQLGAGDGTFTPGADLLTDRFVGGMAGGDFNGDGHPDFVVLGKQNSAPDLLAFLSDGHGSFQVVITTGASGLGPLVAGDFDRDGHLDLVEMDRGDFLQTPSLVQLYRGHGDGTFGSPEDVSQDRLAFGLAVADVNHDAILDILIAKISGNDPSGGIDDGGVAVLLGDGYGHFSSPVSYPVEADAVAVVTADLNGDGDEDLAVASLEPTYDPSRSARISVLFGHGDGTFSSETPVSDPGLRSSSLVVGDFDADGKIDIAARYSSSVYGVAVFRGKGDGTFQKELDFVLPFTQNDPHQLFAGDVNQDRRTDILFSLGDGVGIDLNHGPVPRKVRHH